MWKIAKEELEELELVPQFKFLGVTLDSNLTFKKHIKNVRNKINFNIANFRQIRPSLTLEAAKSYLHCMVLSHVDHCLLNWSFTSKTALKPLKQSYYQATKVLDNKPRTHHHCKPLKKHNILSFKRLKRYKAACFIYKCLNGLAPPPTEEFIHKKRDTGHKLRADAKNNCEVDFRHTEFSKNVLSVEGSNQWNSLPVPIKKSPTISTFKGRLKKWLLDSFSCKPKHNQTRTPTHALSHPNKHKDTLLQHNPTTGGLH